MSDPERPGRHLKFTLVVRDEADDSSILDIVRVALEDGLHTPAIGSKTSTQEPHSDPSEPSERTTDTTLDEVATRAREAVEEALAKVIEECQAAGKEPKFDPAKWAAQLSKLWAVIRQGKAAGVQLRIPPTDDTNPAPRPEGS